MERSKGGRGHRLARLDRTISSQLFVVDLAVSVRCVNGIVQITVGGPGVSL